MATFKDIDEGIDEVGAHTNSIKWWTIVNTVFTVISGTALLLIALMEFLRKK